MEDSGSDAVDEVELSVDDVVRPQCAIVRSLEHGAIFTHWLRLIWRFLPMCKHL